MKLFLLRRALLTLALVFPLLLTVPANAQDDVSVVGSGVVAPLVQTAADAAETPLTVEVTGTTRGIELFCTGAADATLATRPLSVEEENLCTTNGVTYVEALLGHAIVALVVNPSLDPAVSCLSLNELSTLLAPSATGATLDWAQVTPASPSTPLSVVVPPTDSAAYALIDGLIEGEGLRTDATNVPDAAAMIAAVEATPGALGIVALPAATDAGERVRVLQYDGGVGTGCALPSAETVEARQYGAADRLLLYVKPEAAGTLAPVVTALLADAAAYEGAGLTPPTEASSTLASEALANQESGRVFSSDVTEFSIPETVSGVVAIGGSPIGLAYVQGVTTAFSGAYPGVTFEQQLEGEPAGFRRLCNGELDVMLAYSPLPAETETACDANNITTSSYTLGGEGAVLVGNANTAYLECLTTEQLATVWRIESQDAVTTWGAAGVEAGGDAPLFLFAPEAGSAALDLLLVETTGAAVPVRHDVAEVNPDPLYRAAAVGNVEGALTVMSWADYQSVVANKQQNVRLVQVDGGAGCVEPSAASIADGSYPLSRPLTLIFSVPALAKQEVQSVAWSMLSDANYGLLSASNVVGVEFSTLPTLRERLQADFAAAAEAAVEAAEATPEATAEATDTADAAATPDATEAPDADADTTPDTTEAADADATAEATP